MGDPVRPPEPVIEWYKHHGTNEQFHSKFKTDLDLVRPPSGKFDIEYAIPQLAFFAYNYLCLHQGGLIGAAERIRHPAKRSSITSYHVPGGEVRRIRLQANA